MAAPAPAHIYTERRIDAARGRAVIERDLGSVGTMFRAAAGHQPLLIDCAPDDDDEHEPPAWTALVVKGGLTVRGSREAVLEFARTVAPALAAQARTVDVGNG